MPMDKYARQSHKTNQRARRRNNTAQYLLDNQLKQLDRERRTGQVAFQRNLNRVKSELSNLEGAYSDFNLPLDEDPKQSKNIDADFLQLNKTKYTNQDEDSSIITDPDILMKKGPGMTFAKRFDVSSSSSITSSMDDMDNTIRHSSFPCLASSTPIESNNTLPRNVSGKTNLNPNRLSSCEYNKLYPNLHLNHTCNYFPCKLPQTYHTLGFRRDDLCPHNEDYLSPQCLNHDTNDNLFGITSGRKFNNSTGIGHHTRDISHVNTNWIKPDDGSKQKFNPTIQGPVFGYRPADPVLERIRENLNEPKLNAVRPCARVTIRDRIRGVKQLVKEMKMSNEKIKPEDWATNYGKRVPTRVLLNPVVPV